MKRNSLLVLIKLTLALVLSSSLARAHEVVPTIADLTIAEGSAELSLQINLEAFLAGVDLDLIADTDDAPQARDYDSLRALTPEALIARAPEVLAIWNAQSLLQIDGTALPLQSVSLIVPEGVNAELPRIAQWDLAANAPEGTQATVAWPAGSGDLVLRQLGVDAPFTGLVSGGESVDVAIEGGNTLSGWHSFTSYIPVGFDHILPKGLDHILFVLGLFFLSTQLRPLVWQVSTFTLAHTVTLAMGALGLVNVPGAIVEPLIAASIVYVAVENIFRHKLGGGRTVVIFGFGLLHGLGFASVLGAFGLPEGQFVPALIGFNVGVELGQLTVIAIAFVLVWLAVLAARRAHLQGPEEMVTEHPVMFRALSVSGSLLIALIGLYWVIERTVL